MSSVSSFAIDWTLPNAAAGIAASELPRKRAYGIVRERKLTWRTNRASTNAATTLFVFFFVFLALPLECREWILWHSAVPLAHLLAVTHMSTLHCTYVCVCVCINMCVIADMHTNNAPVSEWERMISQSGEILRLLKELPNEPKNMVPLKQI